LRLSVIPKAVIRLIVLGGILCPPVSKFRY
jgi:hypothetical protein